jgi:hypothetical protein
MWLACHTQEEIAEAVGAPQQTVADQIKAFTESVLQNQTSKAASSHAVEFEVPAAVRFVARALMGGHVEEISSTSPRVPLARAYKA